jgi:hypothetical protein
MTDGETPESLSWTTLAAERLYVDCELLTNASTTSSPRPAFANFTTSATLGANSDAGAVELLPGAGVIAEGDVGATVLCPYAELKGSASAATKPNRLKFFSFIWVP